MARCVILEATDWKADRQDNDTPSAGGQSDSEEEKKPKISTPRQKAAARVKAEQDEIESPVKKVSRSYP
jgi:hypothetical protein